MRKAGFLLLFILGWSNVSAQIDILKEYSIPAYSLHIWDKRPDIFTERSFLVLFPSDTSGMTSYIERFDVLREDGSPNYKFEHQLERSDFKRVLFIYGPAKRFKHWKRFGLPIRITENGIEVHDIELTDPGDGFSFYTDESRQPARFVITGNSIEAFLDAAGNVNRGYDFVATRDQLPTFFGNFPDSIVDGRKMIAEHYEMREHHPYRFYLSKNMKPRQINNIDSKIPIQEKHIEEFCAKMEVSVPDEKILCFVHTNQD